MRARRSRFTRIYHRLTRRVPNRQAQWQQIGQLRPRGSMGRPAVALKMQAQDSRPGRQDCWDSMEAPLDLDRLEVLPELEPIQQESRLDRGSLAVAALTATLFLL